MLSRLSYVIFYMFFNMLHGWVRCGGVAGGGYY